MKYKVMNIVGQFNKSTSFLFINIASLLKTYSEILMISNIIFQNVFAFHLFYKFLAISYGHKITNWRDE